MNYWVIIVAMDSAYPGDDGMLSARRQNRRRAESFGLSVSCLSTTKKVEVFSPDGTLEYRYERGVRTWQCVSPRAQEVHVEQIKELFR